MTAEIPKSVKCRITGVEHKIVHGETNKEELDDYLLSLVKRMDKKEMVNIAIDCEGFALGTMENSLGLIQFAECFTPNFLSSNKFDYVSINLKPGFLVKMPIDKKTVELMSDAFGHKNVTLITFDFTGDFVAMNEAGIKLNMSNVIDSQPNRPLKGIEYITYTMFQGMATVCMRAKNSVEYMAAKGAINNKKSVDFNYLYYKYKDAEHPFDEMLNNKFWNYASSDIALTAIALVSRLGTTPARYVKRNSHEKATAFLELQQKEGLRAPAFARQYSFMNKTVMLSKMRKKAEAYKLYKNADVILKKFELYEKLVDKDKRCTKEEILEQQRRAVEIINSRSYLLYLFLLLLLIAFFIFILYYVRVV
jgi:hypothetical protein